ncbi:hypothetical protein DPMN_106550 [Dreissena polymorpha]|uniref:Uncharacterized protein n=1 Tax=Dreissena polymorpha TaxID=45954 RepID=A0A9D4K595_DREPO|nr:hypothetical protein DPMN_106550 [Dreissena polymorpha]
MIQPSNIIGTNLLTKFHEDQKLTSREKCPAPGSHFHEDRTVNMASRVLTRFYYSHIRKNAPPLGRHTNLLTKFHEDWTITVASRPYNEKCPAPGGKFFKATKTIFELIQYIIGTNLQTKFHDDRKINVTSRKTHVLTKFHEHWTKNVTSRGFTCFHYIHIEKTAPPPDGHVFSSICTIFELVRDINQTSVLTKFHDDWAKIVTSRVFTRNTAPPPGGHVFQRTRTIFELNQHII